MSRQWGAEPILRTREGRSTEDHHQRDLEALTIRTTIYAHLFGRLADLIPSLQSVRADVVFCAPPRILDDMAVYCHIVAAEGDTCLVELADDDQKKGMVMPMLWLKLRVDMANKPAEVLGMEDTFDYQVIYTGDSAVNPHRTQINMFAMNWL